METLAGIDLDSPDLQWIGIRFVDKMGKVFRHGDHYVRAIYRERVEYAKTLHASGLLDQLAERRLIPPQAISEVDHPKFGLLMTSPAAAWKVHPSRYALTAVRDAAITWLEINRVLEPAGYGLCDGHYGNFAVFGNSRPHWVDIGSIVPLASGKEGIAEFFNSFIFPLLIMSQQPARATGKGLLMKKGGTTRQEALDILGGMGNLKPVHRDPVWAPFSMPRKQLLQRLVIFLRELKLVQPKAKWSDYRGASSLDRALRPNYLEQAGDPRDRVVLDLVRRAGAKDVLDVGCNDGLHSIIFAAAGYDVLGVDTDAYAIDKFYGWLRKHPEFNVAVSIDNFKTLAHKASTVVSLALTHHLALTAKMPFDEIARRYADMSRDSLIVEFMPNGLGSTVKRPDPLPDDYRLEVFLDALKQHFGHVEVVDYARPEGKALRTLIYCTRKAP